MSLHIDDRPVNRNASLRGAVRYLHQPTEFEIQAFLFSRLLRLGYMVRGEVGTHKCRARFDLAFFDTEQNSKGKWHLRPVRIVEVKRCRRSAAFETMCGQQVSSYYDRFGVPVDLVGGIAEARKYLERIPSIQSLPADTSRKFFIEEMIAP